MTIVVGEGSNLPDWVSAAHGLTAAVADVRLALGSLTTLVDRIEGWPDELLEHDGHIVVLERENSAGFLRFSDLYPAATQVRQAAERLTIIATAIEARTDDPWPDPFDPLEGGP